MSNEKMRGIGILKMDDNYEITLKNVCCTCLNTERKLSQLCRVDNGVNELFSLLAYNSEAHEAIFVKDFTQLYICWECAALIRRLSNFREQACNVQAKLNDIADGKVKYSQVICLSKLAYTRASWSSPEFGVKVKAQDNFVNCGPDNIMDIKMESDEDLPLAELSSMKNVCNETEELLDIIPDEESGDKKDKHNVKNKDTKTLVGTLAANVETHDDYSANETSDDDNIDDDDIKPTSHEIELKSIDSETCADINIVKHEVDYDDSLNKMLDEDTLGSTATVNTKNKKFKIKDASGYDVNIPIENGVTEVETYAHDNVDENNDIDTPTLTQRKTKCDTQRCWEIIKMSEDARIFSIHERKSEKDYINAMNKCESCLEIFENCDILEKHITDLHTLKRDHSTCKICKVTVSATKMVCHLKEHYLKYLCRICKKITYDRRSFARHLKTKHYMQDSYIGLQLGMLIAKCNAVTGRMQLETRPSEVNTEPKAVLETKQLKIMIDDPKGRGYACVECHKYFKNKNLRSKHVQKFHREGYQCTTCGKKFPFTATLWRHEKIHCNPKPREQCPVCGKMVRADLKSRHAQTHTSREKYTCVACDKKFACQSSYENHLKYSRNHVDRLAHKHKCATCGKDYRSPGELRDHINYIHMGKTHHKCPICDKALATARCVNRHVRRAHHGLKESAKDNICQTCGKRFTCTKSLREHELIHTGERPLSCDMCASTFRQKACLYTHKRRVHKVPFKKRVIQHTEDIVVNVVINKNND